MFTLPLLNKWRGMKCHKRKKVQRKFTEILTDNSVTSARGTTTDKKNVAPGSRSTSPALTDRGENTGQRETLQR
jgi:hypothetical protein